ncbi:helix-turn-helix domain-containing protein [Cohnella hashimotonis]|uniref:AraC family transcriptional regulator n=1 Tax=Cohnella hashimotonis TaxID=2826895 RepID=A0ABT6TNC0_9BACL|nr:AraC family transcriptional regulator [Cohnella hashimotonis]MDI4647337.1 AraC family transcriptional regulator [Cohnella hashimotonis]
MKDNPLRSLLAAAELTVLKFDNHRLRAINYRNRVIQDYYMMTYVRSGSAKLRVEDRVYDIPPGTVIFIPPLLEHDQYKDTDEETEFLWWHFTYRIQNAIDVLPFLRIPFIYPLRDHRRFEDAFDELMLCQNPEDGHLPKVILQKAKSLELLYVLLDNAVGQAGAENPALPPAGFLSLLLKIATRPEANFTLAELAKELHMNPTYVSNQFKKTFGKSPILLHREMKIAKAKSMLETGERTVADIGADLGFQDVQSFTRLFKKYAGISPSQYKRLFDYRPV